MVSLKSLKPHLFSTLLKHQNPSLLTQTPPHIFSKLHEFISAIDPILPSSLPQRAFSTNTQLISPEDKESSETVRNLKTNKEKKKPLDVLFDEAVGRIRNLKKKKKESILMGETKPCNLYSMFTSDPKSSHSMFIESSSCEVESDEEEENDVYKQGTYLKPILELSPEMILFVHHLYKKGYMRNATFLPPDDKLDFSCFSTFYSRTYLRNAAERFAKDNQEIAICLSEDDVKKLALFGCSFAAKKTVYAAERLRSYFSIPEDIVSWPCKLNSSCKSECHPVENKADDLNLADVMKILTLYALELVPPQLTVPDEIKGSVSKLLKQVLENSSCEEESDVSIELKPMKKLSPEMVLLVHRLYEKGYLKDANFLPSDKLDLSCFSTFFSRTYLRKAADRFGKDHQEMAKCLSESDVRRLALFGCPSVSKKTAFAAKRLRSYFSIPEDEVCRPCILSSLCTYKYKRVTKKIYNLNLADVMKILTSYSLELLMPLQLTVPSEINDSINKLLKQVVEHIR